MHMLASTNQHGQPAEYVYPKRGKGDSSRGWLSGIAREIYMNVYAAVYLHLDYCAYIRLVWNINAPKGPVRNTKSYHQTTEPGSVNRAKALENFPQTPIHLATRLELSCCL